MTALKLKSVIGVDFLDLFCEIIQDSVIYDSAHALKVFAKDLNCDWMSFAAVLAALVP